jgi:heme-degrading monooxygenase HmoA
VKGLTRSVLVIRAKPGCRDRLVELFSRLQVLEKASRQQGFVSCEVQVPADDDEHVLVTALWTSPDAYQGWLDNPVREDMRPELEQFAETDPESRVYTVVEALALPRTPG